MSASIASNIVSEHYNKKTATDLDERSKSPIFYLRNFNNWIKSVLINEYIKKIRANQIHNISVLDLGAGKGGDILKWKKANVSRVTFLDIADKSLEECKNRYFNPVRCNFDAEFIHSDATRELIKTKMDASSLKHELVSCQFCIHYSFESFKQADTFVQNVSDSLKPGGYFIGTTTDANEVVSRLKKSDSDSFGNELYNIKFYLDEKTSSKTNFPLFGMKFDFQLDNVVECPEYLINFEALIKIAKRHNLEYVFNEKFSDFFEKYSQIPEYKKLISIMKAMEPYCSKNLNKGETLSEDVRSKEYQNIENYLKSEDLKEIQDNEVYVTLSESEWAAIQLYQCFAFVKVDSNAENLSQGEPNTTETVSVHNTESIQSNDPEARFKL